MSDKKREIDRVEDVIEASNIALDHLSKQGIIVFKYEVTSVFKRSSAWFIIIEGETFNGVIVIKSKTGEVATTVKL